MIREKIKARPSLLLKTIDACRELGGIHPRTLSRLEKAGLIKSIDLLRHKLWAYEDIQALVNDQRRWKAVRD